MQNERDPAFWLAQMDNRRSGAILPGLERVRKTGEAMGLLHTPAVVITVAGTNGKGSTVAALEALYLAGGYRVCAYTSPHVLSFHERIRFQGEPISDAALCDAFTAVAGAPSGEELTGFEWATLAALSYFRQCDPDVLILEVGLGGRLDAVNILDADVAVLTTIDFDHEAFLGNTRAQIGLEKIAIARTGKPLVMAEPDVPEAVLAKAQETGCRLVHVGTDYGWRIDDDHLTVWQSNQDPMVVSVPAIHPAAAASALITSTYLQDRLPLDARQRDAAMQHVRIMGRLQRVNGNPEILLDVSHNAQSVRLLAETLRQISVSGRVHAVFSALGDKDLVSLIRPMVPLVDCWYPGVLEGSRAASQRDLLQAFSDSGIRDGTVYPEVQAAWDAACHAAQSGDLMVVYGSFMTVGAVMASGKVPVACKEGL